MRSEPVAEGHADMPQHVDVESCEMDVAAWRWPAWTWWSTRLCVQAWGAAGSGRIAERRGVTGADDGRIEIVADVPGARSSMVCHSEDLAAAQDGLSAFGTFGSMPFARRYSSTARLAM